MSNSDLVTTLIGMLQSDFIEIIAVLGFAFGIQIVLRMFFSSISYGQDHIH